MLFVAVKEVTLVDGAIIKLGTSIPVPSPIRLFLIISLPALTYVRYTAGVAALLAAYVPNTLISLNVISLQILSAVDELIIIRSYVESLADGTFIAPRVLPTSMSDTLARVEPTDNPSATLFCIISS